MLEVCVFSSSIIVFLFYYFFGGKKEKKSQVNFEYRYKQEQWKKKKKCADHSVIGISYYMFLETNFGCRTF